MDLNISVSYARKIFEDSYNEAVKKHIDRAVISTCDLGLVVEALKLMEKEQAVLQAATKTALHELCKFPDAIILTAFAYAHKMVTLGLDVTETYDTAVKNSELISTAYREGYRACMERMRQEVEHEHNDSE